MTAGPAAARGPSVIPGGSAEEELLLSCCHPSVDADARRRIEQLMDRELDWTAILRAAHLGAVTALLHVRLREIAAASAPPTVMEQLSAGFRANTVRSLMLSRELCRVVARLEREGIRAIPYKGPTLAVEAYGDLKLRQSGDLDILVEQHAVERAGAVLESLGYRREPILAGWEYHYIDHAGLVVIDLHAQLAPQYFPAPGSFDQLWAARRPVDVGGSRVLAPAQEEMLFIVAVHFAKDCWEHKERISEAVDVAWLAARPSLSWQRVLAMCDASHGRRLLLFALETARRLVGGSLPPLLAEASRADRQVDQLSTQVCARLRQQARGSDEVVRYRTEIWYQDSRFFLRLRERPLDRLRYLRAFSGARLQLWLTPTAHDRAFVPLPSALTGLYYLVRPVRIAAQQVGRLRKRPDRARSRQA